MSYWVREIAGWVLVLLGIGLFLVVYEYCERRWIFEAGIVAVVGIFVFRGGIHLLKVAIAARMCKQTQELAYVRKSPEPIVSSRREATGR